MDTKDDFPEIPEWGRPFMGDVHTSILELSGHYYDPCIIKHVMRRTFALAGQQLQGLEVEIRNEKITKVWLAQLAEEAFIRQLLHWLSISPASYFHLLYSAFQKKIRYRIAFLLKKPEDDRDVDDCVQETFVKIFSSLLNKASRGHMPAYPFVGWLYSVANSICHDYWKKLQHPSSLLAQHAQGGFSTQVDEDVYRQPDLLVEMKEREERVRSCIERLPEPCRACVLLFYYDALPLTEIATRLHLPVNKVKYYIYQLAERRFRKLWLEQKGELP